MQEIFTDILILGAGLSGMRAALGALEIAPQANVVLASRAHGPSGSSFSNRNNVLGMQALESETECQRFEARTIELGKPGYINPDMVNILARESFARYEDLRDLGLDFRPSPEDPLQPQRFPGCFDETALNAVILTDLAGAFYAFSNKIQELGGSFINNVTVRGLLATNNTENSHPNRVCGAILQPHAHAEPVHAHAKCVILALGGPASLYAFDVSGRSSTGFSYGLMQQAGARLENTKYLQFMWHETNDGPFFPIHQIAQPGMQVKDISGTYEDVPEALFAHKESRSTHCPFGYELEDAALDLFLASHLSQEGTTCVRFPENQREVHVAPMAHAGNGGAVVDSDAWTSVPGLYACGECATGMHGANRIGGAMVLATQVFGRRAGLAAGREFLSHSGKIEKDIKILGSDQDSEGPAGALIPWLHDRMQRYAILGGRPGIEIFAQELEERFEKTTHWFDRLRMESARVVVKDLMQNM